MTKHLTKRRVVCYLLYFTLACSLVFGVSYARYTSTVVGTGTAGVAAVEMNTTLDLSGQLQNLQPGDTKSIPFSVNNAKDGKVSQVTQTYTIRIATTGNLPLTYALVGTASGGGTPVQSGAPSEGTWTGGVLPHTVQAAHQYTLTVTWPAENAAAGFADEIDLVTLTVDAVQADPGKN